MPDRVSGELLPRYDLVFSLDEPTAKAIGLDTAAGTSIKLSVDEYLRKQKTMIQKVLPLLNHVWSQGYQHVIVCGTEVYGSKSGTLDVDVGELRKRLPAEPLLLYDPNPPPPISQQG